MTRAARSTAERQRAYRDRQRRGLIPARAWLSVDVVERLVDAGLIADEGTADPDRLGDLVALIVAGWTAEKIFADRVTPLRGNGPADS